MKILRFLILLFVLVIPALGQVSYQPMQMYISTSDVTVTNTTTETSIMGTGVGTRTLAADYLQVGKAYRMTFYGTESTPALFSGNLTRSVYLGPTKLASGTATNNILQASSTNLGSTTSVIIVVRSIGVTGSVKIVGVANFTTPSLTGSVNRVDLNNGGNAIAINTTIPLTFDVTDKWSSAASTQISTTNFAMIEELN